MWLTLHSYKGYYYLFLGILSLFAGCSALRQPASLEQNDDFIEHLEAQIVPVPLSFVEYPKTDVIDTQRVIRDTVSFFYISQYEITNKQYLIYVQDIKQKEGLKKYAAALPDTTVWRDSLGFNEPYVQYYFRHPSYNNYPVVGVTYEQAKEFCNWLTVQYNENPKRKYDQVIFRLPTKLEWYAAARGEDGYTVFPWQGYSARNAQGQLRANFLYVPDRNIYRDEDGRLVAMGGDDNKDNILPKKLQNQGGMTYPVKSFEPNSFGIYNLAGNVEEFVEEEGITKGGSWYDPGYYLLISSEEQYDTLSSASKQRGFRFVMEIVEQ